MAAPPDGVVGHLYHLNLKVNCNNKGYQQKWHIVNSDAAVAKASAISIATAYRRIIPADAEVYYATLSNYSTKRDSRFLRAALGQGLFLTSEGPDVEANFDTSFASIKLRMENTDGGSVTMKINPVPDAVLTDEAIVPSLTDVVATYTGDDPAAGTATDYVAQFLAFCQILTKHSVYVKAGAVPGGAYTFWRWDGAYAIGVSKKKGSRAFA